MFCICVYLHFDVAYQSFLFVHYSMCGGTQDMSIKTWRWELVTYVSSPSLYQYSAHRDGKVSFGLPSLTWSGEQV
jgi:hypothetical protein